MSPMNTTTDDNKVAIMMDRDEARDFWLEWVRDNPSKSPFLTSMLSRWEQLVPEGGPEPISWQEGAMEDPQDLEQVDWAQSQLEETLTQALNRAAWKRLLEITVDDHHVAVEMDLLELYDRINETEDPLARVALIEQVPVSTWTQIGWLVAWWLQDPWLEGLPTPAWATHPELTGSHSRWDLEAPPEPTWLTQWLRQWGNSQTLNR